LWCLPKLFIIFLSINIFINISSAGVAYTPTYNRITIDPDENVYNVTTVYISLIDQYNESYVNEHILEEISPGVWVAKTYITNLKTSGNEIFWINSSDVTGLYLGRSSYNGFAMIGYFEIDGVNLIGWDIDTNTYMPYTSNKKALQIWGNVTNTNMNYISDLRIGTSTYPPIDGSRYENITMNHSYHGIIVDHGENIVMNNITIKNGHRTAGAGIDNTYLNNSTISNLRVINASNPDNPATGAYALQVIGNNNIAHDIYINGISWSGTNILGLNWMMYNITVIRSGHNGFELQSRESTVTNLTVKYSTAHNFLTAVGVEDPYPTPYGNTIDGYYGVDNGSGYNIYFGENLSDMTLKNLTFVGDGIGITDSHNVTVINCTQSEGSKGIFHSVVSATGFTINENHKVIDSTFSDNSYYGYELDETDDFRILNTKNVIGNPYAGFVALREGDYSENHYLDISVKDENNSPVSGASVVLTNNIDESAASINGYANEEKDFITGSNGHTPLPNEDRSNSPAITEYHQNAGETAEYFSHTATITTPDNRTIYLSAITPDSSWYREDPNIPTYTITAIIPNESNGPRKTGFAPSEENPFNPGDEKIFRVWTDEPLTNMTWHVDDSVYKGGMNHTWTVEEGGHTISFVGSNANGTVNKSWEIMGGYGALPASNIEFSPADTALTRNIGEPVTFSVSSDQPLTTNWYINGELDQKNTAFITQSWETVGIYNVTVNGSSGEEMFSHTWTVDAMDSAKSQNASTVAVTPDDQIVTPNQPFTIDVRIDPSTPIVAAQFDLQFDSSMVRANSVSEGNLLKQDGAGTLFNSTINNSEGTVTDVYGVIVGKTNVSSEGVFATISMTAGNKTGISELNLSNVRVLDTSITDVPISISNATVLVDTAPVLNLIDSKSVSESNTLSFTVDASDADGDSLTYSAAGLPEGANFDPVKGEFTWTPATGQAGVYTVTIEVSDGYLKDQEDVIINVKSPNRAPVIDSFEPEDGSSFNESEEIDISVSAFDLDGQFLSYIIKINGIKCSTDPSYIWKTNYSSSGEHTVEVTVSDGIDQVTEQHTIYINDYYPPWDVVMNGEVDIVDLATVGQNFETPVSKPYPRYDVNQDGKVNIQDLSIVGYHFGERIEKE